jgi:hypothetical protein
MERTIQEIQKPQRTMPFFSTSKAAENPGSVSWEPAQLPPPPPPSPLQPSAPPTPGYQPRQVFNVPSGNSEISSEPGVMPAEERRSGDMKRDLVEAVKVRRGSLCLERSEN